MLGQYFECAFGIVFGAGLGVLCLVMVAAFMGLFDDSELTRKK